MSDREKLGRIVREAWVRWAKEQPAPKASWLVPWEGLDEPDREVDRQIGEAVRDHLLPTDGLVLALRELDFQKLRADAMRADAAEVSLLTEQKDDEAMPSDAVRRVVRERDAAVAQLAALRAHACIHGYAALVVGDRAIATTAEEHDRRVRAESAKAALSNAAGGLEMSARSIGEYAKADDDERRTFTARDVRKARQGAYEECADTLRAGARARAADERGGRALPVIATCGACGWARDGGRSYDGPLVTCGKITHNSLGWRQTQPHDSEPPPWCPLRGA